jgi:hypothetical protein
VIRRCRRLLAQKHDEDVASKGHVAASPHLARPLDVDAAADKLSRFMCLSLPTTTCSA